MKRKFILLPITLVSLSPIVSMVGCNNPNTPEEKTEFTISTGKMTSATEGTFQFGWANNHSLTFGTDWEFTTSAGTVKSVTATGGDTRPQTVSITFEKEIIETDITDGKLTFTYSDLTAKKDNISATIENICITKYTPPEPECKDIELKEYYDSQVGYRYKSDTYDFKKNGKYNLVLNNFQSDGDITTIGFIYDDTQTKVNITVVEVDVNNQPYLEYDEEFKNYGYLNMYHLQKPCDINVYIKFNQESPQASFSAYSYYP